MASTTTGLSDATRAIRALEAEFQRHANALDAAAMTDAFYSDDARLLPPNAAQVNGKAAIRDFWKAFLAARPTDVTLETGEVAQSGDLAYGIGKYSFTASGARQQGKYLVVYRKQADGGYRAVADMFSPNE
jgi:uncharacterized protein (TIGR02246 family)